MAIQGANTPVIDARLALQDARIQLGAATGKLSPQEAQQLSDKEQGIRDQLGAAKSDGTVTPDERRQIRTELNDSSKDIYQGKHNGVTDDRTPHIHERRVRQHERIAQGVASGELTPDEAKVLRDEQRQIGATLRADKADGQMTNDERDQVRELQNGASRDIYELKHNPLNIFTGQV